MATAKRVRVRLRIDFGRDGAIGPGKVALLEAIERTGSLSQAATQLGMSYRRAWGLIQDLNQELPEPAATATVGGAHGGGARLTPFALELIAAYRSVEREAESAALARFGKLLASLPASGGADRNAPRPLKRSRRGGRRQAKRR